MEYLKKCVICGLEKDINLFAHWRKACRECLNAKKRYQRGRGELKDEPREQNAARSRTWYAKHRDEVLDDSARRYEENKQKVWKIKEGPCVDCKQTFHPCVMEFDHVKPGKVNKVSSLMRCSMKTILEEIEKCELVCSNCHSLRTWKRHCENK